MKIDKLEISNFLTIGSAKLELSDRGLLLIQGVNEDDPSAKSNGAGKSSIVDALCWAIYGVTASGVSTDAVINRTAKKNCVVTVTLTEGDQEFTIARHRKHATHKNSVLVGERNVAAGGTVVDLSKGTDKETQEVINKIMGCSLDVFMAAVYAGQEKMPDLPRMTDKMLKVLIEEAAGVEALTEAYAIASKRYNTAQASLDIVASQASAASAMRTRLEEELKVAKANVLDFENGRRDRAKAELAKVLPISSEIVAIKSAAMPYAGDADAIKSKLKDLQAQIDSQAPAHVELHRLRGVFTAIDRAVTAKTTTATAIKNELIRAKNALATIDERVGKPCGECGKHYEEHDLAGARVAQETSIAEIEKRLQAALRDLKAAVDERAVAYEAEAKHLASMVDMSDVAKKIATLNGHLLSINEQARKVEAKEREIAAIKAAANAKLTEANPWANAVKSKEEEIFRNDKAESEIVKKLAEESANVEILANAVKVFGPAGVRAHILDTVTPYLNDRTRDYLGALSDGNIHAVWTTLSKTAKGDLKEKFSIEVTNDKGSESFAGLSGGEKRKVRLATVMALQDMVASRAAKPIDIFIGDEIDDAIDDAGLERLMGVLERKARERGTVLVISHKSLDDWIPNVITVTKSGGVTTASGATERGF